MFLRAPAEEDELEVENGAAKVCSRNPLGTNKDIFGYICVFAFFLKSLIGNQQKKRPFHQMVKMREIKQ